uniref:ARAD1B10340p n=1 Tax=Blastobotrys adeninivorans TaxID=409370 RepID=A0A060T5E2_BLAAD
MFGFKTFLCAVGVLAPLVQAQTYTPVADCDTAMKRDVLVKRDEPKGEIVVEQVVNDNGVWTAVTHITLDNYLNKDPKEVVREVKLITPYQEIFYSTNIPGDYRDENWFDFTFNVTFEVPDACGYYCVPTITVQYDYLTGDYNSGDYYTGCNSDSDSPRYCFSVCTGTNTVTPTQQNLPQTSSLTLPQTPSQTPSVTPSQTPSETPSQAPSQTPSEDPSETPTQTPSGSQAGSSTSETPTVTPTESQTNNTTVESSTSSVQTPAPHNSTQLSSATEAPSSSGNSASIPSQTCPTVTVTNPTGSPSTKTVTVTCTEAVCQTPSPSHETVSGTVTVTVPCVTVTETVKCTKNACSPHTPQTHAPETPSVAPPASDVTTTISKGFTIVEETPTNPGPVSPSNPVVPQQSHSSEVSQVPAPSQEPAQSTINQVNEASATKLSALAVVLFSFLLML